MNDDVEFRKRVADLVAIIGRDRADVEMIERAVKEAKRYDKPRLWPPQPLNTSDKKSADSIASSLRNLETKLGFDSHAALVHRATYFDHEEFDEWVKQLRKWRLQFEAYGKALKSDDSGLLPIDGEGWPLDHKKKRTKELLKKRRAVEVAAELLTAHGMGLPVTERSDNYKGSTFCRAAAVLYGDPLVKIAYQCTAFKKARKRGSK